MQPLAFSHHLLPISPSRPLYFASISPPSPRVSLLLILDGWSTAADFPEHHLYLMPSLTLPSNGFGWPRCISNEIVIFFNFSDPVVILIEANVAYMTILLALSITFAALLVIAVILMIVRYRHSKYTSSLPSLISSSPISLFWPRYLSFTFCISSIFDEFIPFASWDPLSRTSGRLIANDCIFLAIMISKTISRHFIYFYVGVTRRLLMPRWRAASPPNSIRTTTSASKYADQWRPRGSSC